MLRLAVAGGFHAQGGSVDLVPRDLQGRLGDLGLGPGGYPSLREAAALVVLGGPEAGGDFPDLLVLQQPAHQLGPGVVVLLARGPGQQHGGLDAHERRGHLQELAGFVELRLHERLDGGQELARDAGDGNVEDVDVLGADQMKEKVQRSVEAVDLDDQQPLASRRRRDGRLGADGRLGEGDAHPTAIRMTHSNASSTGAKTRAKASRKKRPAATRMPMP